jgi:hypothetical protein
LFVENGEPRRFLRRDKFVKSVVEAPGDGAPPTEEAAMELWLYLGGATPPPPKKKQEAGFFGSFAAKLKDNALGSKDTRPKDKWGDTTVEITVMDSKTICLSDIGRKFFTVEAFAEALVTGGPSSSSD